MGYDESLVFRRKAGMVALLILVHSLLTSSRDWQPSLEPRIPTNKSNFDYLYRLEDEAKVSRGPPSKRQQGGDAYISPDTSGAAFTDERMGPPPSSASIPWLKRRSISSHTMGDRCKLKCVVKAHMYAGVLR